MTPLNQSDLAEEEVDLEMAEGMIPPVIPRSCPAYPFCSSSSSTTTTVHHPTPSAPPEEELSDCFPRSFYCHQTHVLMKNPVVRPDGFSVERSTVLIDDRNGVSFYYYPNRALQAIIQEVTTAAAAAGATTTSTATLPTRVAAAAETSTQNMLTKIQHVIKGRFRQQMIPEALSPPLNDAYFCPITYEIFQHPLIDPEGYTFEKDAIEEWVHTHSTSPVTRSPLHSYQLYVNRAMIQLLQDEKDKPEHRIHPTIRKWKNEQEGKKKNGKKKVQHQTMSTDEESSVQSDAAVAQPRASSSSRRRQPEEPSPSVQVASPVPTADTTNTTTTEEEEGDKCRQRIWIGLLILCTTIAMIVLSRMVPFIHLCGIWVALMVTSLGIQWFCRCCRRQYE